MNLIEELLRVKSCSVVGMEKNTGKTVTLDYLLSHLPMDKRVAVTSIGLDGESKDQVFGTRKPEIHLRPGQVFATSEKHYRQRYLTAELLDVSDTQTALGRLVTARVLTPGKVLLSGPGSTAIMRKWMDATEPMVDLILVDGALSRMSLASPAVSEAMILATGAAYSANIDRLVRDTAYRVACVHLPLLPVDTKDDDLIRIPGALTDARIEQIMRDKTQAHKAVLIPDFTHIFASEMLWRRFYRLHPVYVEKRSRLIGITVNPCSPQGIRIDSELLCQRLMDATGVPAIDLLKE